MIGNRMRRRTVTAPDVRALAVQRLAGAIERKQRELAGATPEDLAEAILSDPDVGVGDGLVDTDELGGRHAAVEVWLPIRLSGPASHEATRGAGHES